MRLKVVENISTSLKNELDGFSRSNWGKHNHNSNEKEDFFASPDFAVIGYFEEQIVGLLFVFLRNMKFKKRKVYFGGIGSVVVDVKKRRQGIATKILQKTLRVMRLKGVDVSILCTDIDKLKGLYSKVGFVPLERSYYFTNKSGKEDKESGGMIAPVCSKGLFDEILKSKVRINVGVSNF